MISTLIKKIKNVGVKRALTMFDAKFGIGRIETLLTSNWFNPFATAWINLRSFPLKQAIIFPIYVFGRPSLRCLSGSMRIVGNIRPGMIKFNKVKPLGPNLSTLQSELVNQGSIIFKGKCSIGTGTKIATYFGASLILGDGVVLMDQINIGCMKSISIDTQTRISHRCQIFDSNYHYIANRNNFSISDQIATISIGQFCWIGNSTSILPGSILQNYTVVASHSLINKDLSNLPPYSIVGGCPAALISSGFQRVFNSDLENALRIFFKNNPKGSLYALNKHFDFRSLSLNS